MDWWGWDNLWTWTIKSSDGDNLLDDEVIKNILVNLATDKHHSQACWWAPLSSGCSPPVTPRWRWRRPGPGCRSRAARAAERCGAAAVMRAMCVRTQCDRGSVTCGDPRHTWHVTRHDELGRAPLGQTADSSPQLSALLAAAGSPLPEVNTSSCFKHCERE